MVTSMGDKFRKLVKYYLKEGAPASFARGALHLFEGNMQIKMHIREVK